MEKTNSEKIKESRGFLKAQLKEEKQNIIENMGKNELIKCVDDDDVIESFGIKAKLQLRETECCDIYINCGKNLKPCSATGRGSVKSDVLDIYFWIPIVCIIDSEGDTKIERYTLNLMCQDIDIETGNMHQGFWGQTQIWHNLFDRDSDGGEVGGEINPKPEEILDSYLIIYSPKNAFPKAIKGRTYVSRIKEAPWGIKFTEIWKDKNAPQMDIFEKDYDVEKYTDFILRLIRADINKKYS